MKLPDRFDPLGPTVKQVPVGSGRTAHFIDEGDGDWRTVLFFGGLATSVRAFGLLEFARRLREQLRIRVVSVERNGIGQTPFDPAGDHASYVADVLDVLDRLELEHVALMAISGGGPYSAHVAATIPERVTSVHLACAFSERLAQARLPDADDAECARIVADPASFWRYPPDSPTHRIPGFADASYEEGLRAFHVAGQDWGPRALAHERRLLADLPLPDLSAVRAPVYLYWGTDDQLVPIAHARRWEQAFRDVARVRLYDGEGHDVQYRHWEQILVDIDGGPDRVLICDHGETRLVDGPDVQRWLADGATLGSCAWG